MEVLQALSGTTGDGNGSVNIPLNLSSEAIIAVSVCVAVVAVIVSTMFFCCCCCCYPKSHTKKQQLEDLPMSGITKPTAQ